MILHISVVTIIDCRFGGGPYRFPVFRAIIADKSVSAMVNSGLQPFSPQLNMCTYVSMLYI